MFDRVLNKPLDYLSCFAMVTQGNVEICQTEYSILTDLIQEIFPLF